MSQPSAVAAPASRMKPEYRITLFYFVNMMPLGAAVVYAGVWFVQRGLNADQIGIVNSLPVMIMIVLNLSIGRIADRAKDWRSVIVWATAIQAFFTLGLFLVDEFWGILAVWTLVMMPSSAIGPVADAATMRLTRRNGTSFGPIRAAGTIGYTLIVALTGFLVDIFGGQLFVPLFVGLSMLKALAAQGLPQFRAPPGQSAPEPVEPAALAVAKKLKDALKPWFVLPLCGQAMVFGTHLILNAFAALLWKAQGISESGIGILIFIGAVAEALMMLCWKAVSQRLRPLVTLLIAAGVAAFRWVAMSFSPPFEVLVFLQLLHAFTFAMGYLSCVSFIAQHTDETIAAEAQSFYVVLQQVMTVIAVIGFGALAREVGAHAYLAASGFALLGMLIIAGSGRADNPNRPRPSARGA